MMHTIRAQGNSTWTVGHYNPHGDWGRMNYLTKACKSLSLALTYAEDGAVLSAIRLLSEGHQLLCKERNRRIQIGLIPNVEVAMLPAMTPGGKCRCGKKLPDVFPHETPYQFCTIKCKQDQEREDKAAPRKMVTGPGPTFAPPRRHSAATIRKMKSAAQKRRK